MTITLSATTSSALSLGRAPAQSDAGPAFGGLLDATLTSARRGDADPVGALRSALATDPVAPGSSAPIEGAVEGESGPLDALAALLEDLETLLETLEAALESDTAPDQDLLGTIEGLVAQISGLFGSGDAEAFSSALSTLPQDQRQALGDLLDTVAGLANRASGSLGEGPTADALDRFARLLDRQAAAIPAADPNARPDMLEKLARAETTSSLDGAGPSAQSAKGERDGATSASTMQPAAVNRPEGGATPGPDIAAIKAALSSDAASAEGRPEKALDALMGTATAQSASATQTTVAPGAATYARPDAPINLPYIATEIARQVQNGMSRFEIRLNPPEMGRIDVRLEFDPSGNVTARLAVERAETLDLLQRDQRALERALAQAGLDSGKTNLEFSLRQGSADGRGQHENPFGDEQPGLAGDGQGEDEPATPPTTLYRGHVRADAVNLWI